MPVQLQPLNSQVNSTPSRQTAARPCCYARRHLQCLLLCCAVLLVFQPCMALDNWCSSSTPSLGKYSLSLESTCTLTSQVQVSSGNELSITGGAPTELPLELAVITQNKVADKDLHRLFWVEDGALILAFVRLTGGRVKESYDGSLPGSRAMAGGLVCNQI